MIKKKINSTSRKQSQTKLLFAALALFLLGFAVWFWRTQLVAPQVAEISGSNNQSCQSNITSLSLSQECMSGTYEQASYTCVDGTKHSMGGNGCNLSVEQVIKKASLDCGQSCRIATPTPTPTSTPMPSPTMTPRPSMATTPTPQASALTKQISCNVEVFKVPRTESGDTSGGSGLGYFKPEYLVADPNNLTVRSGDRLAYRVTLINENTVSVGDTYTLRSTNYNGTAEPVARILSMGGACSPANSEFPNAVYCQAHASIGPNSSVVSNAAVVLEYNSASSKIAQVGTTFTGRFGSRELNCPMKPVKYELSNRPTPTPLPSAPVGCYYQERSCIQGFFGGTCTPRLVCPSSPVPVASTAPNPSPVASAPTKPSFPQCYRTCRQNGSNFFACVRSCMR